MSGRDKKKDIMLAAEDLFSNRSFHEVTLDEIAQHAKVGKGTIYRFFSSKDDLFFQTATSGFEGLCSVVTACCNQGEPFEVQLLEACTEIARFFFNRRQLFRMMQIEEARVIWSQGTMWDLWLSRRKKLVRAVSEILDSGVREGRVRTDLPAEVLADFLLGMLRTRARYVVNVDETFRRLDILVDIFIHGASGKPEHADKRD